MLKKTLPLLLLLFTIFWAEAQSLTGKISGTIKINNYNPRLGVTVTLIELNKVTFTKEDGSYTFTNLKPGSYNLKVSHVRTSIKEKTIPVSAGKTTTADFNLSVNSSQSAEVNINANKNSNNIPVRLGKARL